MHSPGDDQNQFGYDAEFIPWLNGLIDSLKTQFPTKIIKEPDASLPPIPRFDVEFLDEGQQADSDRGFTRYMNKKADNPEVILTKIAKKRQSYCC